MLWSAAKTFHSHKDIDTDLHPLFPLPIVVPHTLAAVQAI